MSTELIDRKVRTVTLERLRAVMFCPPLEGEEYVRFKRLTLGIASTEYQKDDWQVFALETESLPGKNSFEKEAEFHDILHYGIPNILGNIVEINGRPVEPTREIDESASYRKPIY